MTARSQSPQLLVVEDDLAICDLVRECLEAEGYAVVTADGMEQAVAALTQRQFDLVLSDVIGEATPVPAVDRWRNLDRLRDLAGGAPTIIFTAHGGYDFAEFREHGFSDLLLKPFDLDDLVAVVQRNLAQHTQTRNRENGTRN
jgi:DNA-binding NtrC family response regulator